MIILEILYAVFLASVFLIGYKVVFKLYDRKSKKRINDAKNTQYSSEIRKRILNRRKSSAIVYFSFIFIFLIIAIVFSGKLQVFINSLIIIVVLATTIIFDYRKTDIYGNISSQTPAEFLADSKEFYLYLRGFDVDIPYGEKTKNNQSFNESMFVEVVDYALGTTCCALGMTKEVDSPIGATRVYVNDDDWQNSVLELMKKANRIFILINDRKSCLWEIEQSIELLNKTVFIVDDYEKYNAVRNRFIDKINMPVLSDITSIPFFFESGTDAVSFDNTWKGYFAILGLDADAVEEKKVEERKAQMLDHPLKC